MSSKVKNPTLLAVKRLVRTHPAAPVMMAFLLLRRSPRFVLTMMEKNKQTQAGPKTLKKTFLCKLIKTDRVCPTWGIQRVNQTFSRTLSSKAYSKVRYLKIYAGTTVLTVRVVLVRIVLASIVKEVPIKCKPYIRYVVVSNT